MTQEEKQLLHRAQFEVEQILTHLDPGVLTSTMRKPSFEQLLEMLDCLRVFMKYRMLDLEATCRERDTLAKALRDK